MQVRYLELRYVLRYLRLSTEGDDSALLPGLAYRPKARSSFRMAATEQEESQERKALLKSKVEPKKKAKSRREKTAAMVSQRQGSQPSLAPPRQMLMNEGMLSQYSPVRNVNQPIFAAGWISSPQTQSVSWYPPYFPRGVVH